MSFIPSPCLDTDIDNCACISLGAVVATVPASLTAVTVLPANILRKGAILWNNSTSTAYLKFGLGASSTDFTWKIASQSGYELPSPTYVGILTVAWDAATGSMQTTELI